MTNELYASYLIAPASAPKRRVDLGLIGAGRGGRGHIQTFSDFNAASAAVEIRAVITDPAPGKAEALRKVAEDAGITAIAVEDKIEAVIARSTVTGPLALTLDRAGAHDAVIGADPSARHAILGYIIARLPKDEILGCAYVLPVGDPAGRRNVQALLREFGEVSERNASASIFGEGGNPAHLVFEPLIRQAFSAHLRLNVTKIVSGLEPVTPAFQMIGARETVQLLISVQPEWAEPLELARRVVDDPYSPIRRGIRFMVAEVVPGDGVMLHRVRRRADDKISVQGAVAVDRQAMVDLAQEEELRRRAAEALRRADRELLSRRNPIMTTD